VFDPSIDVKGNETIVICLQHAEDVFNMKTRIQFFLSIYWPDPPTGEVHDMDEWGMGVEIFAAMHS